MAQMISGVYLSDHNWREFRVAPAKYVLVILMGAASLAGGYWLLGIDSWKALIGAPLLIGCGLLFFAKIGMMAATGGRAFKFNAQRLQVFGLLGMKEVDWSNVSFVGIQNIKHYFLGVIPVAVNRSLYVDIHDGSRLHVPTQLASLSGDDMENLGTLFEQLRLGRGATNRGVSAVQILTKVPNKLQVASNQEATFGKRS